MRRAAGRGAAVVGLLLALGGCGGDSEPTPAGIELKLLGRYAAGTFGSGASEIPAFDPLSKRAFVVNGAAGTVDVIDLADPSHPTKAGTIAVADIGGAGVNSVDVYNGIVALAVEANPKTSPGQVALYRAADLSLVSRVPAGALPDMLTFTPNGRQILVANEGEPNDLYTIDPEGSITIVDLPSITAPTSRTIGFTAFNAQADTLRAAGVRVYGPGATVAQDFEPEYIAVSPDSTTAWITLQENNALAVLDIPSATIKEILPLGYKNFGLPGNGIDPSDQDTVNRVRPVPVFGMYEPDGIAAFTANGKTYLLMANEGDARGWTGFNEEARVSTLTLSPALLNDPLCGGPCNAASALGRLTVTTTLGKNPATGTYDALYAEGGRSFSIRDTAGKLVFDSGDELEQRLLATPGVIFNASHDNNNRDDRSDNKGPEPEGVAVARMGDKTFAFVGLERTGGVMVYDVTNPAAPAFQWYESSRDFTKPVMDPASGDLGPEGVHYVKAADSPNREPLLIVGNEISGTTAIYQVVRKF